MSWLQSLGAGLVGAAGGFLLGGPVGAAAGFGIGLFSSAAGMSGNSSMGTWGGAAIGGLAGFAIGGPVGMIAGGLLGGFFGHAVSQGFNQQPQQPPYAQNFPPNFGMPGMNYGFPGMNYGFPGGNFGMGQFPGMYQQQPQINIYNYNQQCCCWPPQNQPPQQGGGTLTQDGGQGKPINYKTSGGYDVTINGHTITVKDPSGKHTVKHWGDPHEEVDGKHVKDWDGKTRTMILGDGTKITMDADSPTGVTKHTSIYDGAQQIQINNSDNRIEKVGFNPWETQQAERRQSDGETSYMGYRQDGSFVNKDIYWQNEDLSVREYHKDLGSEPARPQPPRWSDQWSYLQA